MARGTERRSPANVPETLPLSIWQQHRGLPEQILRIVAEEEELHESCSSFRGR
jgi:hypothetical protein